MATMLTEVGTRVAADFPALDLSVNLFLGQEPDEPDDAVTLLSGPAGKPEFMMGAVDNTPQVPAYEPHRLQVIVRKAGSATSYPDAETLAWQLLRALTLTSVTLSGTRYLLIEPTSIPAPLEEDKQGRMSFVVNFLVLREPT